MRKLKYIIALCILVILGQLLSACRSSDAPSAPQPEQSANTAPEKPTIQQISAPKLSMGQYLRFERISLEQGLSQSTAFCILQDSQGFMWFGTEDGLNKYDGYNFTVYKPDPEDPNSLSVRWIQTLFEDDSGVLWIGTNNGGLSRYDRTLDHFVHYKNDPQDPSSLSHDNVTAIYQDSEGVLWVGTNGGGLNMIYPENENFIHHQHNPDDTNSLSSNVVTVILEDQEGMLWIGTEGGGLNRFDRQNQHWWHFGNDPGYPDNLTHNHITAISEDQSGMLWAGTNGGGLVKYDRDTKQFIHYHHDPDDPASLSSNEITAIYHDLDDTLWVGTYGGGLNRFDPHRQIFSHFKHIPSDPQSLSQDTILSIFQDKEGILWFGTIGGGVNKLNNTWRNFPLYKNNPDDPNSLSDNMVRVFHHDHDDVLWVGSMFGGLDRFERQTGSWHHYPHNPDDPNSLSNDFVSDIFRDRSGILWVGTASGLSQFAPESDTFKHYQPESNGPPGFPNNNIRTIFEDQRGDFWIGTQAGLYQFDRQDESWCQPHRQALGDTDGLGDVWVFAFLEDQEGRIWIGTVGGGLYKYDPENEFFTRYQNDPNNTNSLSNNFIVAPIFQDREGDLWIGNLNGLDRFDPETETFTHYREKDGLPNETVYCIAEDSAGHLWVSTNEGLSRFDPQSETFINYDVMDGLQSNEFNSSACLVNDSGEMFFGGIGGFNSFFPNQISANLTTPPIVITQLIHDGVRVNLGQVGNGADELTLQWPENAFEFEYAALSFAQPEKNQYAYFLEGFEDTWNQVGTRRFGGYTNLPGGSYTLRVKGSNNDGVWNEAGASIKITVIPPIWATWWFQVAVALLLIGAVFIGYRLRVRNIESRSRDLEAQVEERTTELQREIAQRSQAEEALRHSEMEKAVAAERSRLARELHDSVTQSLYSLTLFTEAARHIAEEEEHTSLEQYIRQIGTIGLQALKEMRLLVFELRPPELEKEGLVSALRKRLEAVEGRAGVEARVEVDDLFSLPDHIEQEFFRIAQEALNNALKHAAASEVVVHLGKDGELTIMEIIDDGVGFDPQSLPDSGGMGLKNMHERVHRLHGALDIESSFGTGTRIKVSIDLSNEQEQQGERHE